MDEKEENRSEILVSVIIPVYNCETTVERAVDSVLCQNVPLEILVINDHSTDKTGAVLEKYCGNDKIRCLENKENLGAGGSRNKGVQLAKGKYVAFLDADDWWERGKLEKQLLQMKKTNTVLCCTARELMDWNGNTLGKIIPVREEITYRMLLKHNCINCSSVLLLRQVALEFPMEHEDSHEDYIAWLKILKKYGRASAVNEPLLKYRLSSKGKSGSKLKSAKMTFMAYRYAGFSLWKSLACFCSYAVCGLWKYR